MAVIQPAVAILPRFYSFPKIFPYPLAIWLLWRYLDRPTVARAATVGGLVATAFLFRHDHGVYIGLGGAVAVLVAHRATGPRALLRDVTACAAAGGLVLAPFLGLVQRYEGVPAYVDLPSTEPVSPGRATGPTCPSRSIVGRHSSRSDPWPPGLIGMPSVALAPGLPPDNAPLCHRNARVARLGLLGLTGARPANPRL